MQSVIRGKLLGVKSSIEKIKILLKEVYKEHSAEEIDFVWSQLMQILENKSATTILPSLSSDVLWDSSTAILITYADCLQNDEQFSLVTLKKLLDQKFFNLTSVVHLLPFLSSTSDGGFAVSSYEKIQVEFGDWKDIKRISNNHILMADLVLNHVSSSHPWVQDFIKSKEPGKSYICSPSKDFDKKNVIRARNTSLVSSIKTKEGFRPAWTTFGPDQIDLDWHNPFIIIEFLKLIIRYFDNGIKWIRLDAVGFIWKESGTTCLHREEVHKIVQILRIIINYLSNSSVLITETNVPEKENILYLQSGDEAHLAYNFPLPPLLLECLLSGKADLINQWLSRWPELPNGTGFLNFTASHDGIGLRALEGLMQEDRLRDLLVSCEKRGGLVSHRKMSNGNDKPYELNISWWSAMEDSGRNPDLFQFERFVMSQLFVMALKGVPAFYFQALLASGNDIKTFGKTGERRDLNREKFDFKRVILELEDQSSNMSRNLKYLSHAMNQRKKIGAFHPDQPMICLSKDRNDLVIIRRGDSDNYLWAIHNITRSKLRLDLEDSLNLPKHKSSLRLKDCLTNRNYLDNKIELEPYSVNWLVPFSE